LPSPLDSDDEEAPPAYELPPESGSPTEGRYELMESVSYAFLVALEALTPRQRAVLLLRDVFDYSVEECAEVLALSVANVKTTLHRARKAMSVYDRHRCRPDTQLKNRTRAALESFLIALHSQDAAAVERLLADDVIAISDGGPEFSAAKNVVRGRDRVARLFLGLVRKSGGAPLFAMGEVNGLPAVKVNFNLRLPRIAPRGVVRVDVDADGRIYAVHAVLSTDRLSGVRF
jgi:RNA polymerase sigma-70 factor (ECF subfamily)